MILKIKKVIFFVMVCILTGCSSGYKKGKDKVYFISYAGPLPMFGINWNRHETELIGVDIQTFVDFKCRQYAKDKNHVYRAARIVEKFDAPTFEIIGQNYAKDKNNVYCLSVAIDGSIIENADIETFVSIGKHKAKDVYNVYLDRKILPKPEDIESYEEVNDDWKWGRDKYHYYYNNEIVDVDYQSFEFLENGYFKDKYKVYYINYGLKVIESADAATFKVLKNKQFYTGVAKDKNNYYIGMEKASKKEVNRVP